MSTLRQTPLTCSGHTRPVVFLAFSNINTEGQYYSISACKDGKPMLRSGATGDWIGTFEGHKGAVWGVDIITLAAGHKVIFLDANRFETIKEVSIPSPIYTASLHQDRDIFVCGGEDLKLYKFDFQTGLEIENFKGHFGPVHCVRFSPDGELYASGSEDGTLRLWQTNVGKTYGLWKCVDSVSGEAVTAPKADTLS